MEVDGGVVYALPFHLDSWLFPDSSIERVAPFNVNPQMLLLAERLRKRKTKRAFVCVFVSLCLMGWNKGLKHLASHESIRSLVHSEEITCV